MGASPRLIGESRPLLRTALFFGALGRRRASTAGILRNPPGSDGGCYRFFLWDNVYEGAGVRLQEKRQVYMWYDFGTGRRVQFAPNDYSKYLGELNDPKTPVWGTPERLKAGTPAWKVFDRANGLWCCVSYNTVVSVYDGARVRELGKWSMTTTRHQKMFAAAF